MHATSGHTSPGRAPRASVRGVPLPTERILVAVNAVLGWAALLSGMLLFAGVSLWLRDGPRVDSGALVVLVIGATWVTLHAPFFLVARVAMEERWRERWWWQLSPIAYSVGFLRLVELVAGLLRSG